MTIRKKNAFPLLFAAILFLFFPFMLFADSIGSFVLPQYSSLVSLDFKKADLKDVLKVFSQQIGINFILSESVGDKTVTVYLDKVPVENALEMILSANMLTYDYQQDVNTILVKPLPMADQEVVTRIYQLRYASVGAAKVNSLAIEYEGAASASSSGGGEEGGGTDIGSNIKAVLTKDGKLAEDPRTNSLIITDKTSNFPSIEKVLARLDVAVPQILIDVEMLDVSKNDIDQLGAKYGDSILAFNGSALTTYFPFDTTNLLEKSDGKYSVPGHTLQAGKIDFSGIKFVVNFLKTSGKTRSLARPKILTQDNQTATIQIATDEAIGITQETTAGGGNTSATTVKAERVPTGVFLTVTPQAHLLTNEILLAVDPKVADTRASSIKDPSGASIFRDPEERRMKTVLKVGDGQTVLIGGLLRTVNETAYTKLPIIGDIPLLGAAFRHKYQKKEQRELIIVMTPHIIRNNDELPLPANRRGPFIRDQREQGKENSRTTSIIDDLDHYSAPKR